MGQGPHEGHVGARIRFILPVLDWIGGVCSSSAPPVAKCPTQALQFPLQGLIQTVVSG